MPQPNEVVNVWLFLEEWSRCVSSTYQRDSLYRFGHFDTCTHQWSDLKVAFGAKMEQDEGKARSAIEATYYKTHLGSDPKNSPTAGYIWDLKEKPSWDVDESPPSGST